MQGQHQGTRTRQRARRAIRPCRAAAELAVEATGGTPKDAARQPSKLTEWFGRRPPHRQVELAGYAWLELCTRTSALASFFAKAWRLGRSSSLTEPALALATGNGLITKHWFCTGNANTAAHISTGRDTSTPGLATTIGLTTLVVFAKGDAASNSSAE
mmetsp:Transcript_7480/g.27456  ORF Transcript_7480/g.27456 Transcript_7480/m.27456 type:complete len:158 (+) Transcript_7480:245-718(+)